MNNYQETEEECKCITCELVSEFEALVKENVDWESALRHVLGVATKVSDEQVADMMDEVYRDGMIEGIREAAESMIDLADKLENDDLDDTEVETEKVEDLTDAQVEEIQSILRRQIKDN